MLDRVEDRIGIERAPDETPREYLNRACDRFDTEADDREALIAAYEAVTFGPGEPSETEVQRVLTTLDAVRDQHDGDEARATTDAKPTPQVDATTSNEPDADTASRGPGTADRRETRTDAARGTGPALARLGKTPGIRDTLAVVSLRHLVAFLPALALLPLVTTPIPTHLQATREVATYFQALAIACDGLAAYTYLTVREIPLSLHLESLLAAPLVALGYVGGVRLVSALAALGTALVLAFLARRLFGDLAAVLAPVLLWANPYFYRLAWAAMPEALSVFLTTAAVAATVRYAEVTDTTTPSARHRERVDAMLASADRRWLLALVVALGLAVLHAAWAATVAIPITAVLTVTGRRRAAVATGTVTALALGGVLAAGTLQPTPPARGITVAATGTGVYLSRAWLGYWRSQFGTIPYFLAHGLHLVAGLAVCGYWGLRTWRDRATGALLLGTWTASGLVLPLALPGGVLSFDSFYLWGTVAPLTLTATGIGVAARERLAARADVTTARRVGNAAVALLVVLALANAAVVEAGVTADSPADRIDSRVRHAPFDVAAGEGITAGRTLRERDVERLDQVAFVGRWRTGPSVYTGGITRVAVYGGFLPTGTWRFRPTRAGEGPTVVTSTEAATDCVAMVVREPDGRVTVQSC